MTKIRVLVVDDSAVIRRSLMVILSAESDIEVVGAAPNAVIARKLFEQVTPDVVTLDVELPDVSGLELLSEFRRKSPTLPIIMFSSLTQRAAATTLDALALGASDYVAKPTGHANREEAEGYVRERLIPMIRALAGRRGGTGSSYRPAAVARTSVGSASSRQKGLSVLAIGCSTGGPNALAEVICGLPANFPLPVVVVQHMPPVFTGLLAERLAAHGKLKVFEGTPGMLLEAGTVVIAPGDFHMRLVRTPKGVAVATDRSPPENSCRPAVDVLFRSVHEIYGGATLAVILTGMGQDGLRGCEALRAAGAQVVVQDERTSVVWGMPGAVARAGLADAVVPISEIGQQVMQRVLASEGSAKMLEQRHAR